LQNLIQHRAADLLPLARREALGLDQVGSFVGWIFGDRRAIFELEIFGCVMRRLLEQHDVVV